MDKIRTNAAGIDEYFDESNMKVVTNYVDLLTSKKIDELKEIAAEKNIKLPAKANKEEIIKCLS